jgi:putative inorganic carbon (HCO3(-)) transporter
LLAIPAGILGGLAALAFLGTERLSEFILSGAATSAITSLEGRLEIWTRTLSMIRDFPVTGVGLGMFDQSMDLLYPLTTVVPETEIFHPHNIFLFQAVSSGLPGLVGFLALVLLLLVMAVQAIRLSQGQEGWPLAVGLLGGLVAFLGHGVFDCPTSFIRANAILWTLFGLQSALWLYLREQSATKALARHASTG